MKGAAAVRANLAQSPRRVPFSSSLETVSIAALTRADRHRETSSAADVGSAADQVDRGTSASRALIHVRIHG